MFEPCGICGEREILISSIKKCGDKTWYCCKCSRCGTRTEVCSDPATAKAKWNKGEYFHIQPKR